MLSSTNNNVDTGKWQEFVLDEIQSDHENCSYSELHLSSIGTTKNIDTKKCDSKTKLPLTSISTINADYRNAKHQDINLYGIESDIENCSDNELPLSSIANILPPIDSCKVVKSDTSEPSIKEQNKIDSPMKEYECDICGKIFLRRIAIIEHFRTSLCFPESPFYLERNNPTYNLCNNPKNVISYINRVSNLKTNYTKDMTNKCRICQNVIRNDNFIKRHNILHIKGNNLCNICSVLNSIAFGNNHHFKEKYTWKCKTCAQTFTKLSVLKAHICIFPKNKMFNCYKCQKSYKNLNALEKHKTFHTWHCDICYKKFFKQSSLKYHKRIHNLRSTNQYNIRLKYLNYSVLRHRKRVHSSSQNYECSRCSEVFHKRSEIIAHIFENHQEDYSKYSCDNCTNLCDFSRDYILRLGKNHFKCDVCPQSFTTSHRLQQHYGWHLGIDHFKCEFCPKTFSKCSLYLSHERIHTGERPFRCNFCGEWFPESSNLNIHLKPYKLFTCNVCQKSYTRMSSLLSHKRIHAKEKHLENKSCNQLSTMEVRTRRQCTRRKQFKCNICAKSFFHSWALNAHLNTHKNNKNVKKSSLNKHKRPQQNAICVKCDLCQELFYDKNILITHRCKSTCACCLKVFNNVSSLKRHYRYMHQKNNKLYNCDICKISFMCSTSLNEHRKNHTQFEKTTIFQLNANNDINTVNEEYKCDLCMKSFFNQAQIFAHILETHY